MELYKCHRCNLNGDPISSMTVDMILAAICPEFHGIFDMTIHAAVCNEGSKSVVSMVNHTVKTSFEVKSQLQHVSTWNA